MRTIVLNQTNIVNDGTNSNLVYKFPSSVKFGEDSEVAITSITMYYSWFNISASLGNNRLSFNWVNTAGTNNYTTYTITIPDGLYEIEDIQNYIEFVCQNAPNLTTNFISPVPTSSFYLVNAAGDYQYYFQFTVNPTAYSVQLDTFNVPTSLPLGWSNPGGTLLPLQTFNPVVSTLAGFNNIVGFSSTFSSVQNQNNSAPNVGTPTNYKIGSTLSYLSTTAPQVQPNNNLLVTLSNIDNAYSNPTSVIYSLVPSVSIGQIIAEKPPEFNWCKLRSGTYNELRLGFLGTDLSQIRIRDPNMTIILTIRDGSDRR